MSKFFRKISHGATKFFNKVGQEAPKILGKISQGAGVVGKVLGAVASNPITMALAPELAAPALLGSTLATQASGLTNAGSYRGNVNQVSGNVLKKMQAMQNTANNPPPVLYH